VEIQISEVDAIAAQVILCQQWIKFGSHFCARLLSKSLIGERLKALLENIDAKL
jgi:hypothetical protein